MKIYSKLVLDSDFNTIEEQSYEYEGPVALAGGGSKVQYGKPGYSQASQIIGSPEIAGPLKTAIGNDIINNPFADAASREYQLASDANNSMYGARGLANSGIAIQGQQAALSDIALKEQAQRAGQLVGLLGTASSSPSFPGGTSPTPRGFMGLKSILFIVGMLASFSMTA